MVAALLPLGWAASTYLYYVRGRRFDTLAEILQGPDPKQSIENAFHTYEMTWEYEFPFLKRMAFYLTLLRAYSIPTISRTLSRYSPAPLPSATPEDPLLTSLLPVSPILDLHTLDRLSRQDLLYVVCLFVVEPYRWVQRFGYRRLTKKEKEAHYRVWREFVVRLGVEEAAVPCGWDEMEEFVL
ncbi:hypothetical protein HK104_005761, partial [Borealophlyctis nickersoniae]